MNCEQLMEALNDYIDGRQIEEICQEFSGYLTECNPCQVVVDNIRQTITLYRAGEPFAMPAAFAERLNQALSEKWVEKFGSTDVKSSSS
jgi:hypothetical protein